MLIAALFQPFQRAEKWKPPRCPRGDEWITKMRRIRVTEYATTWMNLEKITLSGRIPTQKATFVRNVQNRQIHKDRK